jgi:Tfp pilus assembly protein PilN
MQKLRLDFRRDSATPRWVAPALLAVALAFAGDVGFSFAKNLRLEKKNEAALARLDPRSLKPARNASAEELAAARETVQRLSTPWEKLLGALESAASDQVALVSIEPDPKAGTVKISGDSKDYLAVLTYVLNLSRAEALSGVQLARHEQKNDAQKTVGFSVSASWGKR